MRRETRRWLNEQKLSDQQERAVTYTGGPMRILAGAGTGKTHTLTTRFAYLVREFEIPAHQILALTFSRKAAEEMRTRVISHLEGGHRELSISTFHSFCLTLMSDWRKSEGLAKPRVVDDEQRRWYASQVVRTLRPIDLGFYAPGAGSSRLVQDLLTITDRAKEQLLGPDDVAAFANRKEDGSGRLHDLALAFRSYQARLAADGVFDYGDLACEVVSRLRADESLQVATRDSFKHMLVDEFQDTNLAQFVLIKLLCPEGSHLCVVGDPNQSIYAFRGGRAEYIRDFEKQFPGAVTFKLQTNHRSTSSILAAANELIQQNKEPDYFDLHASQLTFDIQINGIEAATVDHEAEWIARRVLQTMRAPDNKLTYGDFAVLVRSLKTSQEPILRALAANGIPYRLGRKDVARFEVVHDLLAALKLVIGPPRWNDAARLAARQGASTHSLRALERKLGEAERDAALIGSRIDKAALDSDELASLATARAIAECAAEHGDKALPALAYQAMLLSGRLADGQSGETGRFLSEILRQAGVLHESGASAQELLDQLTAAHGAAEDDAPSGHGGVHVLTVHAAKGLEWEVVFVTGLAESIFPLPMRLDRDFDLADLTSDVGIAPTEAERAALFIKEERRLAYVAITRGKQAVHLLVPREMGSRALIPSIFVAEALPGSTATRTGDEQEGPAATIVELARRLRRRRQRALAESIDSTDAAGALASLMLAHWAAHETVQGASPIRERLIPEPHANDRPLSFSYSQLQTYGTCPRQYLYSAILRLRDDDDYVASVFGSAVHSALSHFNANWKTRGEYPGESEIAEFVEGSWPEAGFDLPAQRIQLMLRAISMIQRFFEAERQRNPRRSPVAIEQDFSATYGPHRFGGRIDLIVSDTDGHDEIIDFKTGSPTGIDKPAESLQLFLYDLAWRHKNPDARPRVSFYALRHDEDKGFAVGRIWDPKQEIGIQHSEESTEVLRGTIDALLTGMMINDFKPSPSDKACGRCRFRWLCPEG